MYNLLNYLDSIHERIEFVDNIVIVVFFVIVGLWWWVTPEKSYTDGWSKTSKKNLMDEVRKNG